jgi:hypothetical protein
VLVRLWQEERDRLVKIAAVCEGAGVGLVDDDAQGAPDEAEARRRALEMRSRLSRDELRILSALQRKMTGDETSPPGDDAFPLPDLHDLVELAWEHGVLKQRTTVNGNMVEVERGWGRPQSRALPPGDGRNGLAGPHEDGQ